MYDDLWIFHRRSMKWELAPATSNTSMPVARSDAALVYNDANHKLYLFCGVAMGFCACPLPLLGPDQQARVQGPRVQGAASRTIELSGLRGFGGGVALRVGGSA